MKRLSERLDFTKLKSFQLTGPDALPHVYEWMQPSVYAVYDGSYNGSPTQWGWEIDYIKGQVDRSKSLSLFGYSLYLGIDSTSVLNWMDITTLFIGFGAIKHPEGRESIDSLLGRVTCVKARRKPELTVPAEKVVWYHEDSLLLLRMEVYAITGDLIYTCTLSDITPATYKLVTGKTMEPAAQQASKNPSLDPLRELLSRYLGKK